MKPALTREEWEAHENLLGRRLPIEWEPGSVKYLEHEFRHAIAALCLYGQPFGFTREDVELLRELANDEESPLWPGRYGDEFNNLADRIEALLPPEDF